MTGQSFFPRGEKFPRFSAIHFGFISGDFFPAKSAPTIVSESCYETEKILVRFLHLRDFRIFLMKPVRLNETGLSRARASSTSSRLHTGPARGRTPPLGTYLHSSTHARQNTICIDTTRALHACAIMHHIMHAALRLCDNSAFGLGASQPPLPTWPTAVLLCCCPAVDKSS